MFIYKKKTEIEKLHKAPPVQENLHDNKEYHEKIAFPQGSHYSQLNTEKSGRLKFSV